MPDVGHPELVIIAALAEKNRVIGKGLDLPWRIPADLKRFKALTLGHPVVMGRRTFDSLLFQFGGPLTGRDNVVLSRYPLEVDTERVHVFHSLEDARAAFSDRPTIFIGGGASVYEEALPFADRLELTIVEGDFDGDAFFPRYDHLVGKEFERVESRTYPSEDERPAFRFETLKRIDG